jgi:hypothetical protein
MVIHQFRYLDSKRNQLRPLGGIVLVKRKGKAARRKERLAHRGERIARRKERIAREKERNVPIVEKRKEGRTGCKIVLHARWMGAVWHGHRSVANLSSWFLRGKLMTEVNGMISTLVCLGH